MIRIVMEGILSGCPVLEILEVRNYCGFNRLEVTSPSLREFCLSRFEHAFDEDDDDDDDNNEDAYLAISAPNLRVLTISSRFYAWNVCWEDVKSLVVADLSFNLGTLTLMILLRTSISVATCYRNFLRNSIMLKNRNLQTGAFRFQRC